MNFIQTKEIVLKLNKFIWSVLKSILFRIIEISLKKRNFQYVIWNCNIIWNSWFCLYLLKNLRWVQNVLKLFYGVLKTSRTKPHSKHTDTFKTLTQGIQQGASFTTIVSIFFVKLIKKWFIIELYLYRFLNMF